MPHRPNAMRSTLGRWFCSGVATLADPLYFNLFLTPRATPQWYAEAEKTNGRWAMAAVAGILFTEILGKAKWFEVGPARRLGGAPLVLGFVRGLGLFVFCCKRAQPAAAAGVWLELRRARRHARCCCRLVHAGVARPLPTRAPPCLAAPPAPPAGRR